MLYLSPILCPFISFILSIARPLIAIALVLIIYSVALSGEFNYDFSSVLPASAGFLSPQRGQTREVEEVGFIFPRCVRTEKHGHLWKENYRCIRQHFPTAPIVIIDDNSNSSLIDEAFSQAMIKTTVFASDVQPGAGEVLPYYYYYYFYNKTGESLYSLAPPFKKAVILNDGMFIVEKEPMATAINQTTDYRLLWYFDGFKDFSKGGQDIIISAMKPEVQDEMTELQAHAEKWVGCFASAMIISWSYLDYLQNKYGFLDAVPLIDDRADREGLERITGMLTVGLSGKPRQKAHHHVYGDIFAHKKAPKYTWDDYVADKEAGTIGQPAIKIWNGRRR